MIKDQRTSSLINFLKTKRIAVIGYGSQGRAQSLNLRDSGINPIIGLSTRSKSRAKVLHDRLKARAFQDAISESDIISILIPDHKHEEFFGAVISPKILQGKALVFAHGMSVAFGLSKLPKDCDIIMVAPHGPGVRIRELYQQGKPFTSFWAVEQDHSGQASKIARAYAAAIGSPPSGLFKSSFHDEAVGDIFGEQAVLCGGLIGLMKAGFDTLVARGFTPENAYLECIYQLDLIADLVKKYGPAGMLEKISVTAAFGSIQSYKKLFDKSEYQKFDKLFVEIESGKFVSSLVKDNKQKMIDFRNELLDIKKSLLQRTHKKLIKKLNSS